MVPLKAATPCRPARQLGSGLPACFASLSAGRQTPDGGFVLQTTTLEFRDATENVLASWPYSPALFIQDPNDPLRRILDTFFTPPPGLAGALGLHLLFLATAQVTDPVSGQPETVEASAEAPVTVKPAVSPLLAVSFTGPASLEAGAAGSLAIEITTSNPSQTTAAFRLLLADGTEVQSAPIDLSGFQVAGDRMSGTSGFTAPATAGLYLLVVSAERREGEPPGEPVETASSQSPLTVTPAPEPEPWLDITTPSPIVTVEGSEVSVDFSVGPPSIRPLITGIKWKVLDGASLLFGGAVDPASLREGEPPGEPPCLLGRSSFTVPKGIVSAPTDLTLQVVAEVAGNPVSGSCVLRVSPAPEEPIALSIYAVPEPRVLETETVEYRFLMTPPEIFPSLLGGTFALVERASGNPLFVQNIDLATLTVNSHITGAVSFEVPLGAASAGGGVLNFVLTFWTDEQTASAGVPLDVLPRPLLRIDGTAPVTAFETISKQVAFTISPGEASVLGVSWALRTVDGLLVLDSGTVAPESLTLSGGVWTGTLSFTAPPGSWARSEDPGTELSLSCAIAGCPVPVVAERRVEIREIPGQLANAITVIETPDPLDVHGVSAPVTVEVLDYSRNPLPGQAIGFAVASPEIATFSPASGATGADGRFSFRIIAGWWPGTYELVVSAVDRDGRVIVNAEGHPVSATIGFTLSAPLARIEEYVGTVCDVADLAAALLQAIRDARAAAGALDTAAATSALDRFFHILLADHLAGLVSGDEAVAIGRLLVSNVFVANLLRQLRTEDPWWPLRDEVLAGVYFVAGPRYWWPIPGVPVPGLVFNGDGEPRVTPQDGRVPADECQVSLSIRGSQYVSMMPSRLHPESPKECIPAGCLPPRNFLQKSA